MTASSTRFTIVVLLLGGTGLLMNTRVTRCIASNQVSVASLPLQLGDWTGIEIPVTPQTLKVLHGARILERAYFTNSAESEVDLYLAYYPNQHAGDRRHLPEDCLAGSGWSAFESGKTTISLQGRESFPANRFLITKAGDRQLLLYWFWARGRGVASEQRADAYLLFDSLRFNRRDDALIRINSPISPREETSVAERRLLSFATQVVPAIDNYFPR